MINARIRRVRNIALAALANKGGGGETTSYNTLNDKPKVSNVTLQGNVSLDQIGAESKIKVQSIPSNGVISAETNSLYQGGLTSLPSLNVTFSEPLNADQVNVVAITFVSGDVATVLTVNTELVRFPDEFSEIEANKFYELNFMWQLGKWDLITSSKAV